LAINPVFGKLVRRAILLSFYSQEGTAAIAAPTTERRMSTVKTCVVCATDLATKRRLKDTNGNYFCPGCYEQARAAAQSANESAETKAGTPALLSQTKPAGSAAEEFSIGFADDGKPAAPPPKRGPPRSAPAARPVKSVRPVPINSTAAAKAGPADDDEPVWSALSDDGFSATPPGAAGSAARMVACQGCSRLMEPGTALCTFCGYDARTGKTLKTMSLRRTGPGGGSRGIGTWIMSHLFLMISAVIALAVLITAAVLWGTDTGRIVGIVLLSTAGIMVAAILIIIMRTGRRAIGAKVGVPSIVLFLIIRFGAAAIVQANPAARPAVLVGTGVIFGAIVLFGLYEVLFNPAFLRRFGQSLLLAVVLAAIGGLLYLSARNGGVAAAPAGNAPPPRQVNAVNAPATPVPEANPIPAIVPSAPANPAADAPSRVPTVDRMAGLSYKPPAGYERQGDSVDGGALFKDADGNTVTFYAEAVDAGAPNDKNPIFASGNFEKQQDGQWNVGFGFVRDGRTVELVGLTKDRGDLTAIRKSIASIKLTDGDR
jgi:hypothetical protein